MKKIGWLLLLCQSLHGQPTTKANPKLVVGIIVDQMKYEYVFRYWDKMGNDGFKRLMQHGYFLNEAYYNYAPTITAPGHASVYTGTTPATHGIISNSWYDKQNKTYMYCTQDNAQPPVGALPGDTLNNMSPKNLLTTTIGDELRLNNNFKNKVIGVAIKDRGAILPAGRSGNAAYWWDSKSKNFITSTYYMQTLPNWVKDFNARKLPDTYLKEGWHLKNSIKSYTASTPDNTAYEGLFKGEKSPVFPHLVADSNTVDAIKYMPQGNDLTLQFAMAAINNENLGSNEHTDMITISFSSTDYAGHRYGTHAIEMEDMYIKLDNNIHTLIDFLEQKLGKENILLFLTADHAASPNAQYLADHKINAGYFNFKLFTNHLNSHIYTIYGDSSVIEKIDNDMIYFNRTLLKNKNITIEQASNTVYDFCLQYEGINHVVTARQLINENFTEGVKSLLQKGFYQKRCGDVMYHLAPGLLEYGKTGTTHGSAYSYDTHIPVWFYGNKITPGICNRKTSITDIAPTICNLLHIEKPNGCTGLAIPEVCK